ncbi:MAG: hypothetical protein XD78_1772 [Desulfotomaculum sp. 46_296]|nr:MAG: hypothetical protein XD78_1772 [Desulfotomaculum sp. 46_296]HAU32373.1 hypothetical protein [Desulfotomaculum sp.]
MTQFCIDSNVGDELCPAPGDVVSYHTQIPLSGLLEIPLQKPPKEQIFNTTHEIDITKYTALTVKKPPGKKVLVAGKIMAGIEYIAKVPDQKVHFAHWDIPFQALIKNDNGSLLDLAFNLDEYIAHVCVEHEEYMQIDERTISMEIVLLIWLQRKDN